MKTRDYENFVMKMLLWPDDFKERSHFIAERQRLALALGEELGEYNGKLKRWLRGDYETLHQLHEAELGELGDILFYVYALIAATGHTTEDVMEANVKKLKDRADRGVIKGKGDKR